MRRILCAIDHSEPSLRAARIAVELARKCDAELSFLTVAPVADGVQPGIAEFLRHEHSLDSPRVVVIEAARDELALLGDRLGSEAGVAISCVASEGDPATEIVASARANAIDLIVIGHRGRRRIAQALMGSVARRVVDTAPCPVLIVQ
jgi:nucleotide-binding universal stress UspA family protein